MHISTPPQSSAYHETWAEEGDPHERALGRDGPAPDAGALRDMPTRTQEETSESQLIAR